MTLNRIQPLAPILTLSKIYGMGIAEPPPSKSSKMTWVKFYFQRVYNILWGLFSIKFFISILYVSNVRKYIENGFSTVTSYVFVANNLCSGVYAGVFIYLNLMILIKYIKSFYRTTSEIDDTLVALGRKMIYVRSYWTNVVIIVLSFILFLILGIISIYAASLSVHIDTRIETMIMALPGVIALYGYATVFLITIAHVTTIEFRYREMNGCFSW